MSKLIIHIGMPKTGSSSIQETLFSLNTIDSICYASLGCANHGGVITSYFANDPYKWIGHRSSLRDLSAIKAFNDLKFIELDKVRNKQGDQVISGEGIVHLNFEEITKLRNFFLGYFERIQIIGYVRPPASFMVSAFQQLVKNHSLCEIVPSALIPPYRNLFEKFDKVFGIENVTLRPFKSSLFPNGDVVRDFCQLIDVSIHESDIKRVNESLSLEATAVLFAYRRYGVRHAPHSKAALDNRDLVGVISKFGQGKLRFSDKLIGSTIEKNMGDIAWMEKRLGASILDSGDNSPDTINCEQDLFDIAVEQHDALNEFIQANANNCKPTEIMLNNWIEMLRIAITGRNSEGVIPSYGRPEIFTPSELKILESEQSEPILTLRSIALALDRNGLHKEALIFIDEALKIRPDAKGLQLIKERIRKPTSG